MPTITLNKKEVLKLIGKKINDEKLNEAIPMLGTDLEKIDKDNIIVEVYPNRPDILSEEGFARALSSFLGIRTGLRRYKVNNSNFKFSVDKRVEKIRPYAAAAVIKNIELDDNSIVSLMQLQEKLHLTHGRNRKKVAIGVHNFDAVKFPLWYTAKPKNFRFIPLDVNQEYTLEQILKFHQKGKMFSHLLENFNEYPLWIDSIGQVLSMPPIINSEETKVTLETRNLFLDVTGTDKVSVEQALNILVYAFADRGGKIFKVNNFPDLEPRKIKLDIGYANKLLGLNLNKNQIKKLLERMGLTLGCNFALVPAYRTDVLHQIDVVEDIAIAYGYGNFKAEVPNISTIAEESKNERFKNLIVEILVGLRLQEVNTYHIINKENFRDFKLGKEIIEIKNPKSSDFNSLRPSLVPSLLLVLGSNKHNEYPQRIFECGRVFKGSFGKNSEIKENSNLCVMSSHVNANFTEVRQIVDSLLSNLKVKYSVKEKDNEIFISGRGAVIISDGEEIGTLGELNPEVIESYEIEMPVSCVEINLELLKNCLVNF